MNGNNAPIRHAVLLAAGSGTRLGRLTAATPKCLLPVDGRALLERQLEALANAGIEDVTVVAGFMAGQVVRQVAGRCRVVINEQYATTNSIVSLHIAAPHLRGRGFLMQNADVLYPADLVRRLLAAPCGNACLVDAARPFQQGEYHVETQAGRIVCYSRSLPAERSVGISAQLLRIGASDSVAFLDRIGSLVQQGCVGGFPNQAYDVLMNGSGLACVYTAGLPWWEIDTAEDLARCESEIAVRAGAAAPRPAALASVLGRAAAFLRSPDASLRLRRGSRQLAILLRRPMVLARALRAMRARPFYLPALDLAVYGAEFLNLALQESRALGFEPFLMWGTLLGCVRDGGLIRGDTDLDLGVMEADAARLHAWHVRMRQLGFVTRIDDGDKLSLYHPRHPRLFIDIDVVRSCRDGWVVTNWAIDPAKCYRYFFPAQVFAGTRPTPAGYRPSARLPADAETFLACVYGDWRRPAAKVDYRYGPLNTEVELLGRHTAPSRDACGAPAAGSAA